MPARAATVADVQALPGLTEATEPQITTALALTAPLVSVRRFRDLTSEAHAYRAAHWLATMPGLGLAGDGLDLGDVLGPLASESDGPAARSFGAVASSEAVPGIDADLMRSPYGRAFLDFRRAVRGWGMARVGGDPYQPV